MKKVVCVGEMLIDFVCLDTNTGIENGVNFIKKTGGAPANVAACIGKLGGEPLIVAAVGNDLFGTYLKNEVAHYQVNIDFVETANTPTTLAFVSLADDGEREFAFNRGADELLNLSNDTINVLLENAILHLGSATALMGGELALSYRKIALIAKENGNIISFDPNYRVDLWRGNEALFRQKCDEYLQLADIVKVSDEELVLLTQSSTMEDGCQILHEKGIKIVLVTLGSSGCFVSQNGQQYLVPAFEIDAVDTTGAGDAFIGAVLYKMSNKPQGADFYASQLREFVEFSEKVSGLVCSKIGAMTALPTEAEVESLKFIVKE